MITAQQVFDTAIYMMDEQAETNGKTVTTDTQEYRFRTIAILNAIMPQLYPYSDTYTVPAQGRPTCHLLTLPEEPTKPELDQPIPLDDTLAMGVLPYGLAAHLLAGENEALSLWFLSRYNQLFIELQSKIPASFEPIPTPYGLF